VDADAAILTELHGLRRRLPDITGTVLARVDGLLVTSDLRGMDPDSIAALSAANLGLGQRFALTVGHGGLRETLIHGIDGYVACYAAGGRGLLTVLARPRISMGLLHLEARLVADRLGHLLQATPAANVPAPVSFVDNRAPLDVRSPRASLPHNPAPPRRRF